MSYRQKIDSSKEKVYSHAIATKIRDLMANLRKSANESRKRRWVWELLQNSNDAAYFDQKVQVEIDFSRDGEIGELSFRHNGLPFSVDNITFLIEQVSTKDQTEPTIEKPIGKFGTGFLTTHLLSEIVEVTGVIKEPELPYKSFCFELNRSFREIPDIIKSVSDSLQLLDDLDTQPTKADYEKANLNTTFRYKLNPNGIKVAEIGIQDLENCLPYVLLFVPKIEKVEVASSDFSFRIGDIQMLGQNLKLATVLKDSHFDTEKQHFILASQGSTTVAMKVNIEKEQITFEKLNDNLPRLFCDFPLVGSEDLKIPFVINNRYFSPTEPRDGIDLSDNDDIDIVNNRKFILEAVILFMEIIDEATSKDWLDRHQLAKIKMPSEKDWLSTGWFKDNVVNPIREKLLSSPIVFTALKEWEAVYDWDDNPNIFFPYSPNEKVRKLIWELVNDWRPHLLPHENVAEEWYQSIWSSCPKLDLKKLTEWIEAETSLSELQNGLRNKVSAKDFLNRYFALLTIDGHFKNEIINDTYAVIPNQNGGFKTRGQLFIDKEHLIEEALKDALLLLDVDVREELLDNGIFTGENINYTIKAPTDIIASLNVAIKNSNEVDNVCNFLTALDCEDENFPEHRRTLYEICKRAFGAHLPNKRIIKNWDHDIWIESDKLEVRWLVDSISEASTLTGLISKYSFEDEEEATKWLNTVIEYLTNHDFESKLNLKSTPILPNQNNFFTPKDELFLDDGEIDNDLKDIVKIFGRDYRNELLDKRIFLELPPSRTYQNFDLATSITEEVSRRLSEVRRSEETKSGFRKLFLWFQRNPELAHTLFGDLYISKHKLYDDEEIAASLSKSEKITLLMDEFGIDNIEDIRSILLGAQGRQDNFIPTPINQETLASLGISSLDEFVKALEDKDFARDFSHTSVPTLDMFNYVQSLIDRSIKNIMKQLENHDDYDCSDFELIAPTVIGGITKKGLPIYIVVRPSDNGFVIVYYSSEKDILEQPNAELWVDNGIELPKHLTLGEILKKTGINKIPIA